VAREEHTETIANLTRQPKISFHCRRQADSRSARKNI